MTPKSKEDLEHTKFIVTPELTKLVQKHLFELGITWEWSGKNVRLSDYYIGIAHDNLMHISNFKSFEKRDEQEILATDILKIPIPVPENEEQEPLFDITDGRRVGGESKERLTAREAIQYFSKLL